MADAPRWKPQPEQHDFPAALSYLSLVVTDAEAQALVEAMRVAATVRHKVKDLLRASGLPLLPSDNAHVRRDLEKIKDGEGLSPVLLVRGRLADGRPLVVADGYHRLCAAYHLDEDVDVSCRIVDLLPGTAPADSSAPR